MPSGREIYSIKSFEIPTLDMQTLESMRAPPDREDRLGEDDSSDEEGGVGQSAEPVGAYPGTQEDYSGKGNYY